MSVSNKKLFGEQGFTLLEILIAIVLLAFITLGIVDITENAAQTKERTTEANTNNLQIETAMSRFEWDFSQIYSPLYFSTVMNFQNNQNPDGSTQENPLGGDLSLQQGGNISPALQQYQEQMMMRFERNEHFSGVSREGAPIPRFYAPEKDVFEFFTSSNRRKLENQKQSHFAWVRYSLAPQEPLPDENEKAEIPKSLKSFVRYFTADDPYSDKRINIEDVERIKGAVLLRNVDSLEFQYWDYQKRKWETSLRSIAGGQNLIQGVKIIITWYDSTGYKRTASRIFRHLWPMVSPKDQTSPGVQTAASAQGGNPSTESTTGTNTGTPNGF